MAVRGQTLRYHRANAPANVARSGWTFAHRHWKDGDIRIMLTM